MAGSFSEKDRIPFLFDLLFESLPDLDADLLIRLIAKQFKNNIGLGNRVFAHLASGSEGIPEGGEISPFSIPLSNTFVNSSPPFPSCDIFA